MHNHKHDHCEHNNLAHCETCDVAYCQDCNREWGKQFDWYPYTIYKDTGRFDYPYCVTTSATTYDSDQPTTCTHNS